MMMTTKEAHTMLADYSTALGATRYQIRLIHDDRNKYRPIKAVYTPSALLRATGFLRARNAEGYHIYARPDGYQYVLLDDLTRPTLADLAKLKPCLLLETSPNNFQAWLKLRQPPKSREEALSICRELATMLAADPGSAEPDHVGRLPGFTNQKAKHRRSDGTFPWVILHRSADRISTFHPKGGGVLKEPTATVAPQKKEYDRSTQDFNLACMLIRQRKDDAFIRARLEAESEKAKGRRDDYIGRTIANARKAVKRPNF
jgi:hypothetical protein